MRDSARFWDKLADKYSKKPIKDLETGFYPPSPSSRFTVAQKSGSEC